MSLRGRINQGVSDWRDQRTVLGNTTQPAPRAQYEAPDTSDGVDLAIIIIVVWLACFVAGVICGRL